MAKATAKATAEATKATVRATIAAVKAIIAGTKALISALIAGGWIAVVIILIVVLLGCAVSLFGGGSGSNAYTPVSAEVEAYEPFIQKYAKQYGIPEYVELIKAVMMQESGGRGLDPMQAAEGSFNTRYPHEPNGIKDPEYSIECGVQELKAALISAEVENPIDMEHINGFKAAVAAVLGGLTALWGWFGWLVLAWLLCMALDYGPGTAAALRAGEWSSKVARDGLWHKLGAVVAVLVAAILDGVIGLILANIPALEMPFQYEVYVSVLVLVWYIMTELWSIVENIGALGAPVPAWLRKAIAALESTVDGAGDKLGGGDQRESK